MSVAIRTSTIIASLVANITQAKLSFFASENYDIEEVPKTVEEVKYWVGEAKHAVKVHLISSLQSLLGGWFISLKLSN